MKTESKSMIEKLETKVWTILIIVSAGVMILGFTH